MGAKSTTAKVVPFLLLFMMHIKNSFQFGGSRICFVSAVIREGDWFVAVVV